MREKIAVIFGGRSGEHEVSCVSAASVLRALDKEKYEAVKIGITKEGEWLLTDGTPEDVESMRWLETGVPFNPGDLKKVCDFAFPVLHGPNGEDGTIQGLFEMLMIPYAGCGVLASAACMDKAVAKELFMNAGIPTCAYVLVTQDRFAGDADGCMDEIEERLGYPVFVKPANMGSSVGISKAADRASLKTAIENAAKYDRRIVCEEFINCREIETGVIGSCASDLRIACTGEIIPGNEFYDYTAKYSEDGGTRLIIPAEIPPEADAQVKEIARKAFLAMDIYGLSRIDCFLDKDTGKVFLNEINTMPGFTKYSMFPLLFEQTGLSYPEQIERIITLGHERYNAENNR